MQILAQTPYAKLSFYRPENADKMFLRLCDEHYEEKREGFYEDKWEFYALHRKVIQQCADCFLNIDKDYYSLYHLEVTAVLFPEMRFSFHMPYPVGKTFFPKPKKLPQVEHVEQDGLFRFGRPLFAQEKITHREPDVLANFEQALAETKRIYCVHMVHETRRNITVRQGSIRKKSP